MRTDFLAFPDGWSGLALALLRMSLAAVLATFANADPGLSPWVSMAGDVVALALAIGFFTRLAAALTAPAALCAGLFVGRTIGLAIALHGLDALALALLGAGAYSFDARLFGRHVITLDE